MREYKRDWARYNPIKRKAYHEAQRVNDPITIMYRQKKSDAKIKGIEFSIDKDDLVLPTHCPVLGIPLLFLGKLTDNSPSVDRIDNSKGYVKGNVQVISYKANAMKRNASTDELIKFAKYILTYT